MEIPLPFNAAYNAGVKRKTNLVAFLVFLIPAVLRSVSAQWDSSNGCPGYKSGTHYYVDDRKDIKHCEYSVQGRSPFPEWTDRLSEYECWDRYTNKHRPVHCSGFYINKNYAFWDPVVHDYVETIPECPHSVPSCQDLDEVCVKDKPRHCDAFGTYVCQALDPVIWDGTWDDSPNRTIPQPKAGWCKGKLKHKSRYECPPRRVSTFAEVTKWCAHEPIQLNETHYKCEYHGAVVCEGTIEPDIVDLKTCTREVSSCSGHDKNEACKKMMSPFEKQFCGTRAKWDITTDSWIFQGNVLECKDRHGGDWCEHVFAPEVTAPYVKTEFCPTASLRSCRELKDVFIHHSFCLCIRNHTTGEEQGFQCHHDGKPEPWCVGIVEPIKRGKHFQPIPKKHPGDPVQQAKDYRASLQNAKAENDGACEGPACKISLSVVGAVVGLVVLALVAGRLLRKKTTAGKDGIVYDTSFRDDPGTDSFTRSSLGGPRELEMQQARYSDNSPARGLD